MEANLKNGGLLPSAIALRDSLNQRPATSSEQTMLTSYQRELLLRGEKEIDERLAANRLKERVIFEAFYRAAPDFAGCIIDEWKLSLPNDSPDILCIADNARRIGVELAEWLNEEQMREAMRRK